MEAPWPMRRLNSVLRAKTVACSKMGQRGNRSGCPLTLAAILRSYNFASPGHLEGLNLIEKADLMTEQKDRVLARVGARCLTQAEMAEVSCGFSTPIIITDLVTNFGKDFSVDQIAN